MLLEKWDLRSCLAAAGKLSVVLACSTMTVLGDMDLLCFMGRLLLSVIKDRAGHKHKQDKMLGVLQLHALLLCVERGPRRLLGLSTAIFLLWALRIIREALCQEIRVGMQQHPPKVG